MVNFNFIMLLVDGIVFVWLCKGFEFVLFWLGLEFFVEFDVFELGVGGVGVLFRVLSEFFLFDLIYVYNKSYY